MHQGAGALVERKKITIPSNLPPGALREYLEWLLRLWEEAGEPSGRVMGEMIGCSHTTAIKLFKGLPSKKRLGYQLASYLYENPLRQVTRTEADMDALSRQYAVLLKKAEQGAPARPAPPPAASGRGKGRVHLPVSVDGLLQHDQVVDRTVGLETLALNVVNQGYPSADAYEQPGVRLVDQFVANHRPVPLKVIHAPLPYRAEVLPDLSDLTATTIGPLDILCARYLGFHFTDPVEEPFDRTGLWVDGYLVNSLTELLPAFRWGFILMEGCSQPSAVLHQLLMGGLADGAQRLVIVSTENNGARFLTTLGSRMRPELDRGDPFVVGFDVLEEVIKQMRHESAEIEYAAGSQGLGGL